MKKRFCLVSLAFLISTTMSFSESMLKIVSDQQESDIYINGKFAAKYTGSNVIVTLPEGKYKLEMRKDMDDGSYYHFEKQYELGEYSVRVTAEAKMEQILTEKYYYLRAKKNGNIFDYEDYIKKYPSGKYAADFSKELEELYYQNALRKNTVEAYQKYAEKYSKGKYMGEIKEKLDKLSPKGIVDVIPRQFKKGDEITIYFDVSKSQDIWKYRKILKKNKPEIPLEPEKIFVRYGFNGWEEKYLKHEKFDPEMEKAEKNMWKYTMKLIDDEITELDFTFKDEYSHWDTNISKDYRFKVTKSGDNYYIEKID